MTNCPASVLLKYRAIDNAVFLFSYSTLFSPMLLLNHTLHRLEHGIQKMFNKFFMWHSADVPVRFTLPPQ